MEEHREEEIDIRDYVQVVVRRKWTIIALLAIAVVTATVKGFTAIPLYEATTRLIIEKENPNVVSIQEVMAIDASGGDYYQSQYKIIKSRTVAREVIRRLHLEESEEFFPKPKDDFVSNLRRSLRQTIAFWKDSIVSLLKTEKKEIPSAASEEYEQDSGLVSSFVGRVNVEPLKGSRLVDVSFQARDPVLAAKIVNTLASAYIDQNLEIKLAAVKDAVRWLHERIEEERKRVEKAEVALLRYKEKHHIITDFSSDTERITAQKLAQLNAKVVEAESKRVEAETRYKQAKALEGSPDMLDSIPEVLKNELIRQIKSMEVELYKRMSELSKKYGQKHPRMVAIQSELKTLQKRRIQEVNRVINSLRNEYLVALAGEKSLKVSLATQKQESLQLNQKAIEYGVLRREAESARHMYDLLVKRFKETSVTEDMRTGNIRVIDRAEVPKGPVNMKTKRMMLLAIIVSLFVGIGLAFFFEYLDNSIKIPEDVSQYLKIPYLGHAPLFSMEGKGKPDADVNPELTTLHSPLSPASESYRGIRTNILFSSAESAPQVILLSSAKPLEGKTITAANLAVTFSLADSRVIILDCDMRKPKMHNLFGAPKDCGISNLLAGNSDLGAAVFHTRIPNLDIIPCGPIPPNPSEMLGSTRMASLLNELRNQYAYILIDSSPTTAVTDPVVLSKSVDGVLLVIRAGDTAKEVVQNSIAQYRAIGVRILGAVLNGVNMSRNGYYYYQYYSYYYGEDRGKTRGRE
jgi:succinoglycan biosynthesis transport protein ExoP